MYDPFLLALIAIPIIGLLPLVLGHQATSQLTKTHKEMNQRYKYLDEALFQAEAKERKDREEALALDAQEKEEMKQLLQNLLKCQQVMARAAKENNRLLAELIQVLKEPKD